MPAARSVAGQAQIVVQPVGVEEGDEHRRGRADLVDHAQLFQRRQQPIEAERRADAGQFLLGEQAGQVVVPPAGADAADRRAGRRGTSRRSCRCSSRGRGRSTRRAASRLPARRRPSRRAESAAAARRLLRLAHCRRRAASSCERISSLVPESSASLSTSPACSAVAPAAAIISSATFSRPILPSLSSARRIGVLLSARPSFAKQAVEHLAVVDADRERQRLAERRADLRGSGRG